MKTMKTIKHLVFAGGGPIGIVEYGALKYLSQQKIIEYKNIESIYSVSVGCLIGLIYILNFEWSWMDDFIIKRPWNKLINLSYSSYINILYEKGIVNKTFLINVLEPLFLAKNISLKITLLEFYNLTKIELNIVSCRLIDLQQITFNHLSKPNMELIDAMYTSMTIPILFAPLYIDDSFYLDGGVIITCPINICISDKSCSLDEIFCFTNDKISPIDLSNNFYNIKPETHIASNTISNDANFFEYIFYIIKKMFSKISKFENDICINIKNTINTSLTYHTIDINYWYHVIASDSERSYLINLGVIQATKFIESLEQTNTYDISNQLIETKDTLDTDETLETKDTLETDETL